MGNQQKILVKAQAPGTRVASAMCLLAISALVNGCGQRGPLTLPNDNEFKQRATLPDLIRRQLPELPNTPPASTPAASAPSQPASSSGTAPAKR